MLKNVGGADQVLAAGTPVPSFDIQVPLLSIPGLLGTTLETLPCRDRYLAANSEKMAQWKAELANGPGAAKQEGYLTIAPGGQRRLNIGIAWQGNPKHKRDRYRSAPLACLEPLARLGFVRLFSIQVGPGTEQLPFARFPATDLGSRFDPNFLDDLAAVLSNLDLVVTVDSVVAHLAGALGVPTWVALPYVADWRWLSTGTDTPWYSSLRLFRQAAPGDWAGVYDQMALAALSLAPDIYNNSDAQSDLGSTLRSNGHLDLAIMCFRRALQLDPTHANAHNNLGNALVEQGHLTEATKCYREALRRDFNHALAHNNLGLALAAQGHLDEAITSYRQAVRLDPNYANAYDNLGTALIGLGRLGEGVECFRQALGVDPSHANAHNNLGNTLAKLRLLPEATECLDTAIALSPGHKIALWNRAAAASPGGFFGWLARLRTALGAARSRGTIFSAAALGRQAVGRQNHSGFRGTGTGRHHPVCALSAQGAGMWRQGNPWLPASIA